MTALRSELPADRWLRFIRREPDPVLRLVCFPHAGGTASFFHPWAAWLPDGVELIAVRYPAREDRLAEPSARTMAELVGPVVRACLLLSDAPLALFGHSMGAVVAHEVAVRLQHDHGRRLTGLFVSGRAAPGRETKHPRLGLTDAELLDDLTRMGGTDPRALDDPELRALVLPSVRADYQLLAAHRGAHPNRPLAVAVAAYYGCADEDLDASSVAAWAEFTDSQFALRAFPGGHFYLREHLAPLITDILGRCSVRDRLDARTQPTPVRINR